MLQADEFREILHITEQMEFKATCKATPMMVSSSWLRKMVPMTYKIILFSTLVGRFG